MHYRADKSACYQIKGPMGKGLDIQPTGKHIALAAGTGILVFIDLVAHLILRLVNSNSSEPINLTPTRAQEDSEP